MSGAVPSAAAAALHVVLTDGAGEVAAHPGALLRHTVLGREPVLLTERLHRALHVEMLNWEHTNTQSEQI